MGGRIDAPTGHTRIGYQNGGTGFVTQTGGTFDGGGKSIYLGNRGVGTWNIGGGILKNVTDLYNGARSGNASTNTIKITGSSATVNVNNYRQGPNSSLYVAPGAGGLTAIGCGNSLWLDGELTVDFSNANPNTSTQPLIGYSGSLNGAGAFSATNILTAGWSADVEIDPVGKTVSLINILAPPAPSGTVLLIR